MTQYLGLGELETEEIYFSWSEVKPLADFISGEDLLPG